MGSAANQTSPDATVVAITNGVDLCGTPLYMSPEQIRGKHVDGRSDLFSFGAILYEMVTGQKAFDAQTAPLIFDAILNRTFSWPEHAGGVLDKEIHAVIRRALEKSPDERYQSASEMRSELDGLRKQLERSPATARSTFRPSLVVALSVVIAALLAYSAWRLRPDGHKSPVQRATFMQFTSVTGVELFQTRRLTADS